jgi:hypothetical protein
MFVRLDDGIDLGEAFVFDVLAIFSYCPSGLRGSFILPLLYVISYYLDIIQFKKFQNHFFHFFL